MKKTYKNFSQKFSNKYVNMSDNFFENYKVNWYKNISSTMDKIDQNIEQNIFNEIIVSDYQVQGKGRFDRIWDSKKGEDLLVSIPLILNPSYSGKIPIIVSLAVFNTVVSFINRKKDVSIKWPNDILVNYKKISGILIKSKIQNNKSVFNIGVGININSDNNNKFGYDSTSFFSETSNRFSREKVLLELCNQLSINLNLNYSECIKLYKESIFIPKNKINVIYDKNKLSKDYFFESITNQGLLVVVSNDGDKLELTSEEISFSPLRNNPNH